MSNSPLVNHTHISPNRTKNRNHAIDTVTIHCVVGQCSVESLGVHFSNPGLSASSNYGIGYDGKIGMYVEEKDASWCSSNSANDNRAITIEVASDTTHPYAVRPAAYAALIDLLVDICKRNNIKSLKWKADKSLIGQVDKQNMTVHRWFANKACPGEYLYSHHEQIAEEVNKRLGAIPPERENPPAKVDPPKETYSKEQFVKDVQKATGAAVDGIAGPETLSKTVTVSAKINTRHAVIKPVQMRLYELGYTEVGTADGIAGPKFSSAVTRYQKDNGCYVDGEITARNKTWKKLLGLA